MKRLQSPFVVMPLWSAVAAALLVRWPSWWALAGFAAWPLVEYAAHRWAMHGLALAAPRLYKRVHGVHHLYPRDLSHFTIPIPIAAVVVAGLCAASWAIGAPPSVVGGLLAAFVLYDLAHLAAHGFAPFPFARALQRHHARHHADDARNFGVTTSWIDRLLGTRAP